MKKVLIGTVTLERDTKMENRSFQYAASFEDLLVPKGTYSIYTYADDLARCNGKIHVSGFCFCEYAGTVIAGNVGGEKGDTTQYGQAVRYYELADDFEKGFEYRKLDRFDYELRPEWGLELREYEYDGKRHFVKDIVLKDGAEIPYFDDDSERGC